MAFSTSPEYDNVEFLMYEHSEHVGPLCDIDLTCYETFYDSSPSEDENESIKDWCSKGDLDCLEDETDIGCCSTVPDIDCTDSSGSVHDVLNLYTVVKGELFHDFSPEDTRTCSAYGMDSLAAPVPVSLDFQHVPTLVTETDSSDNIGITSRVNIELPCLSPCTPEKGTCRSKSELAEERSELISQSPANSTAVDSELPCLSPCTPEKGTCRSKSEPAEERSVLIHQSPGNSTEGDSEDADARVPSSCRSEFLPSGWYYIEE